MGHVNAENHSKMRKSSGVNGLIKSTFEITTKYHTHTHTHTHTHARTHAHTHTHTPIHPTSCPRTGISFFGSHVQNDKKKVLTLTFKIQFVLSLKCNCSLLWT